MKTLIKIFGATLIAIQILAAEHIEGITSFTSEITLNKDSSLTVTETITVWSATNKILHGIVREFPTTYKDKLGNWVNIGFKIENIKKDKVSVPFRIINAANGKKIYIGDPKVILVPGQYTYSITYTTNRQIGFFKNFDELYWNVTGNGWRLPIEKAIAKIKLPQEIESNQIHLEAYTGFTGQKEQYYSAKLLPNNVAEFQTTQPLAPHQGFTIVVTWPKGYIKEPGIITKLYYFLKDNLSFLWLALGLLLVLVFYLFAYFRTRKSTIGTVIPLFEPPKNLLPSQIRFLRQFKFDAKCFASEIVNMAVHGLLEINYKKGFFGGTYTLTSKDHKITQSEKVNLESKPEEKTLDHKLRMALFKKSPSIEIKQKNQSIIGLAIEILKKNLDVLGSKYFEFNSDYLLVGILLSFAFIFISVFFQPSIFFFTALLLFFLINLFFYFKLRTYTPAGFKLINQIEGFKMFLSTTETERLKIIGTPPTKTPELYEKYLPYAIALNVEQAWSQQFAPIFAKLEKTGHPYTPVWFGGGNINTFNANLLSSSLTNSVNSVATSTISSSSLPPGSSSGSGGSGSSGGGGGGGGGGGW